MAGMFTLSKRQSCRNRGSTGAGASFQPAMLGFQSLFDSCLDVLALKYVPKTTRNFQFYLGSYHSSMASKTQQQQKKQVNTHDPNARKMQVNARGDSSAKGIEAVWDGVVRDCETSLVRKMSADEVCPAAPSTSTKTMKVEPVPPKWKKS